MNEDIVTAIKDRLPDAQVEAEMDGNHAMITVVSGEFEGMSRVRREQALNACIAPFIESGTLHAVRFRALTPQEV